MMALLWFNHSRLCRSTRSILPLLMRVDSYYPTLLLYDTLALHYVLYHVFRFKWHKNKLLIANETECDFVKVANGAINEDVVKKGNEAVLRLRCVISGSLL